MTENTPFFEKPESDIRKVMAGMPKPVVEAALRFRASGNYDLLAPLITEAIAIYRPKNHVYSIEVPPPETRLRENLGLDSLALTEMAFMFDELFGIPIEIREVAGILTFGQLHAFLRSKLAETSTPATVSPN